ncbi:MAG: nuclear transport factor 2 family protein [Symploca sp. SIO2G7]|nr:nuclear transport factor 2 family protein [Symploca sp. SIO2G7]
MKRNIIQLVLILLFCLTAQAPKAHNAQSTEAVEAALINFLSGASNSDARVHDHFWAEDLMYTSSSGERFGKARIMAGLNTLDTSETSAAEPVALAYFAEDIVIRFENELALLTFTLVAESPDESGTKTIQRYYNSGVLKNTAARDQPAHWQAVLWQATRIPSPAATDATTDEQS